MPERKLLLADDSLTIQKVVNLTFADEGFEVVCASDGDAALSRLSEFVPDLVLADVNMPGPNGYRICELMRQHEQTRDVPVILLVGSFEPFDNEEFRRVGANDYLTKPFQSIRQLVSKVNELLEVAAARNGGEDQPASDDLSKQEADPDIDNLYKQSFAETVELPREEAPPTRLGDPGMDDELIETQYAEPEAETQQQDFDRSPSESVENDNATEFGVVEDSFEGDAEESRLREYMSGDTAEDPLLQASYDVPKQQIDEIRRLDRSPDYDNGLTEPARGQPDSFGEATLSFDEQSRDDVGMNFRSDLPDDNFSERSDERNEFDIVEQPYDRIELDIAEQPDELPEYDFPEQPREQNEFDSPNVLDLPPADRSFSRESVEIPPNVEPPAQMSFDPKQITPEFVEAVAGKVIERISDRVIRQIAWQVVPQIVESVARERSGQNRDD